jgi:hypothetical protein
MMTLKPIRILVLMMIVFTCAQAQNNYLYNYQQLSHLYYSSQKDSIRKAWTCPSAFSNKTTQKKYKEIWDSRTDFLFNAIANDNFVRDQQVYNYIDGIVTQITKANKNLVPVKPLLLIDRSESVNAYALGGNVISVNLGLISYSQSREELALAIAHELSHNILQHAENAMKQRAEWLTSEEYKNSLNDILDSKYERLTRLKKVLETYSFARNRHQRYKESEADSLAIILLKKSDIAFNAEFFLRLDSSDSPYKQMLSKPVKHYFEPYGVAFEDGWTVKRSKGLSTRNYNFSNETNIQDSLKTHPDCKLRYEKTLPLSTAGAKYTPISASVRDNANRMIIWNMFSNSNLTACLYRVLLEKDNGKTDHWYDFMVSNIFSGLYYSDKQLHRFSSIGVMQKEYISKPYYELQSMLEQMSSDHLSKYCSALQSQPFWKNLTTDEKALKDLMFSITLDSESSGRSIAKTAKDFSSSNPSSMYCEFSTHFSK